MIDELHLTSMSLKNELLLRDTTVIYHRDLIMSPSQKGLDHNEIEFMLDAGIIKPAYFARSSHFVIFTRKDGKPSFFVN